MNTGERCRTVAGKGGFCVRHANSKLAAENGLQERPCSTFSRLVGTAAAVGTRLGSQPQIIPDPATLAPRSRDSSEQPQRWAPASDLNHRSSPIRLPPRSRGRSSVAME
jgi:hypothetical protein